MQADKGGIQKQYSKEWSDNSDLTYVLRESTGTNIGNPQFTTTNDPKISVSKW